MSFTQPGYLLLLIPFVLFSAWYWIRRMNRREVSLPISSVSFSVKRRDFKSRTYPYLPLMRFLAVFLLIISLARPGRSFTYTDTQTHGIDIMIVKDISISMLGTDFTPQNRLHASKLIVKDFIKRRRGDRIGLIAFAGEAYLLSPLTADYSVIESHLDLLEFDDITAEGTAIGNAIALAAARMDDSQARSRVILLITDGVNNTGVIDPQTAAGIAQEKGIKIYTVGIGTDGDYTIFIPRGPDAGYHRSSGAYDESSLIEMSELTGGRFFRATDTDSFKEYIDHIDSLEKSALDVRVYHETDERWMPLLVAAFLLYSVELVLRSVYYRKIP